MFLKCDEHTYGQKLKRQSKKLFQYSTQTETQK